MMTCEQIEELLMPYLLDELDEHRDADVYIHLRGCDACRGAAKEMETTVNLLQDAFELDFDARFGILEQRAADAVQQDLVAERLLDKIDGPRLHGFDGNGHLRMAGDNDDGDFNLSIDQLFL